MNQCIFCEIVEGKLPGIFVFRDKLVSVFMDIQPINPGHLLVIPNTHALDLAELEPETGAHMFMIAQKMTKALYNSDLRCEGVNLFLADGVAAGQEVFHIHLHVIPRFENDGFRLTFSDSYAQKPAFEELQSAADLIASSLSK